MGSQELQEEPGLANKIGSEYDDPTADGLHLASDILSRVLKYPLHPPSIMTIWPEMCPETTPEESTTICFAMSEGTAIFFKGVLGIVKR